MLIAQRTGEQIDDLLPRVDQTRTIHCGAREWCTISDHHPSESMMRADRVEEGWVVSEPNDLLRAARERTESPHASGDHLSREELADLVNAWLFEHTGGRQAELDSNYLGKSPPPEATPIRTDLLS